MQWKATLAAAALSVSVTHGGAVAHQPGTGEDGEPVAAERADTAEWPLGKIEPRLLTPAGKAEALSVLVHVRPDVTGELAAELQAVKQRHRPGIDEVAGRIRAVYRGQRASASLSPAQEKIEALAMARRFSPADEVALQALRVQLDTQLDARSKAVAQAFFAAAGNSRAAISRYIAAAGGEVQATLSLANAVAARIPAHLLEPLALHASVAAITLSEPRTLDLAVSVPSAGHDTWHAEGVEGGAWDFGIVDTGVQQDHPFFTNVDSFYTTSPFPGDLDGHGTHVAGIVLSNHSRLRGGAPDPDAVLWGNALLESTNMATFESFMSDFPQAPEVINYSISFGVISEDYRLNDTFYDAFVDHYDVLITKSAGNNGFDSGPTLGPPASAFNLMAVVNMRDRNTPDRSDDVRDLTSSVGPTPANRRKPDIAAPGSAIDSANAFWANDGEDFVNLTGTSQAAPHVAAAVLLLQDAGNHNAMAQKAVLINTADAWTSNNTSSSSDDGPVTGSLWDRAYGWGYLDMDEAWINRTDYFTDSLVAANNSNVDDDYHLYTGLMYAGEKATLVWHKRAGAYVDGQAAMMRYALSDLNLRLFDADTGDSIDLDIDSNDNVHQVASDQFTDVVVKVYSWSTSFEGAGSEDYALATEENFIRAAPPTLNPNILAPAWIGPHQTFAVTVDVNNNGDVPAHDNSATLGGLPGLAGTGVRSFASVPAHDKRSVAYSLTSDGLAAGQHWLSLDLRSDSYQEAYQFNASRVVLLNVETTPPASQCTDAPVATNGPMHVEWRSSDAQTGVAQTRLLVSTSHDPEWHDTRLAQAGVEGTFVYEPGFGQDTYQFVTVGTDVGGNVENIRAADCQTVYDTQPPAFSFSTPPLVAGTGFSTTWTASDAGSGVQRLEFHYRFSGSGWTDTGIRGFGTNGTFSFTAADGDGLYEFTAIARDYAGNATTPGAPVSATLFDSGPPTGTVRINGGASVTSVPTVTLALAASDASEVTQMRLSNNGAVWDDWRPFESELPVWDLTAFGGDTQAGEKQVFAQLADAIGYTSGSFSDSILYLPADTDLDGVDDPFDNCTKDSNADQRDTDGDGYGNLCDADIAPLPNDCVVNFADLGAIKAAFFTTPASSNWNADADLDGDDAVNFSDLGRAKAAFFQAPGPSTQGGCE